MAPYPPQDTTDIQQRKNHLIMDKNMRACTVNIRQKERETFGIIVISDSFQAGELLSDPDCQNTKKQQETHKILSSCDSPNNKEAPGKASTQKENTLNELNCFLSKVENHI